MKWRENCKYILKSLIFQQFFPIRRLRSKTIPPTHLPLPWFSKKKKKIAWKTTLFISHEREKDLKKVNSWEDSWKWFKLGFLSKQLLFSNWIDSFASWEGGEKKERTQKIHKFLFPVPTGFHSNALQSWEFLPLLGHFFSCFLKAPLPPHLILTEWDNIAYWNSAVYHTENRTGCNFYFLSVFQIKNSKDRFAQRKFSLGYTVRGLEEHKINREDSMRRDLIIKF